MKRFKSIEDMVNAGYQYDLRHTADNPDTPYMHIENPIEAMDRIRQNIEDREEEGRLNRQAGVQFGAVVRQGHVVKFPERRKRYVFKLVEEEF
jgi:hypothetical protein